MSEDPNIIDLIERDIMSFEGVSRFTDFGITDNIQKAIGRDIQNPGIRISERFCITAPITVLAETNIVRRKDTTNRIAAVRLMLKKRALTVSTSPSPTVL